MQGMATGGLGKRGVGKFHNGHLHHSGILGATHTFVDSSAQVPCHIDNFPNQPPCLQKCNASMGTHWSQKLQNSATFHVFYPLTLHNQNVLACNSNTFWPATQTKEFPVPVINGGSGASFSIMKIDWDLHAIPRHSHHSHPLHVSWGLSIGMKMHPMKKMGSMKKSFLQALQGADVKDVSVDEQLQQIHRRAELECHHVVSVQCEPPCTAHTFPRARGFVP